MSQKIGDIIAQIIRERRDEDKGTFRLHVQPCCLCEAEFETFAITLDGETLHPDICPSCSTLVYDEQHRCANCGRQMAELFYYENRLPKSFLHCENCSTHTSIYDAIKQSVEEERIKRWEYMCPIDYVGLDPSRLPASGKKLYEFSLEWKRKKDGRGLIFIGPSGTGKTRCMYDIARRLFVRGVAVKVFPLGEFPVAVSTLFAGMSNNPNRVQEWIQDILRHDVLFIDDLGKGVLTERVASILLEIIDKFGSLRKTMLFTTNLTGENTGSNSLISKIEDPEIGLAIVRRIRDYCDIKTTNHSKNSSDKIITS